MFEKKDFVNSTRSLSSSANTPSFHHPCKPIITVATQKLKNNCGDVIFSLTADETT